MNVVELLSYTYNPVNALTSIADGNDGDYSCTVTCDANGNITQVSEVQTGTPSAGLVSAFTYDALNRLTVIEATRKESGVVQYTKRHHGYDGLGRLTSSALTQWDAGDQEPTPDYRDHLYAGARHIGNADSGTTYGERWHWAGGQHNHAAPLKSPNPDYDDSGAARTGYNIARQQSPQQDTWLTPADDGDKKLLYGQGRPMAKDATQAGADFAVGITSENTGGTVTVESRLFFDGTVSTSASAGDLSRATDAREKGRIGILGSALAYAGSYGRVTSESIGRDLNPLGRGDGTFYAGGNISIRYIYPPLPFNGRTTGSGNGVDDTSGPGTSSPRPQVPDPTPGGLGGGNTNSGKTIESCADMDPCTYALIQSEMNPHVNCQAQLGMVNNPTAGLAVKCCSSCCLDRVDCVYPEEMEKPFTGCCGGLPIDCQELWKDGKAGNKDAFGQQAVGMCKDCGGGNGTGSGEGNGGGAGGGTGGGCPGCGGTTGPWGPGANGGGGGLPGFPPGWGIPGSGIDGPWKPINSGGGVAPLQAGGSQSGSTANQAAMYGGAGSLDYCMNVECCQHCASFGGTGFGAALMAAIGTLAIDGLLVYGGWLVGTYMAGIGGIVAAILLFAMCLLINYFTSESIACVACVLCCMLKHSVIAQRYLGGANWNCSRIGSTISNVITTLVCGSILGWGLGLLGRPQRIIPTPVGPRIM